MSWEHQGTMTALTDCRLLLVDAEKFCGIASRFPTDHSSNYAGIFVRHCNKKSRASGDLGEGVRGTQQICKQVFFRTSEVDEWSDMSSSDEDNPACSARLSGPSERRSKRRVPTLQKQRSTLQSFF